MATWRGWQCASMGWRCSEGEKRRCETWNEGMVKMWKGGFLGKRQTHCMTVSALMSNNYNFYSSWMLMNQTKRSGNAVSREKIQNIYSKMENGEFCLVIKFFLHVKQTMIWDWRIAISLKFLRQIFEYLYRFPDFLINWFFSFHVKQIFSLEKRFFFESRKSKISLL